MRISISLLATAAALLLAACSADAPASPGAEATTGKTEVKVGGLFALTSYGAEWGSGEMAAVQKVLEDATAASTRYTYTLVAEDTNTDINQSLAAFRKLSGEGVKFFVGPTWNQSSAAVTPLVAPDQLMLLPSSGSLTPQERNPHVFSVWMPDRYAMNAVMDYLKSKGATKIVVLTQTDSYTEKMRGYLYAYPDFASFSVLADLSFTPDDKGNFSSLALKTAQQKDVQAVVYLLTHDDDAGILRRSMLEQGLAASVLHATPNQPLTQPSFVEKYKDAMPGYLATEPVAAPMPELEAYTRQLTGAGLGPSSRTAYDAAQLLVAAIEAVGTDADAVAAHLQTANIQGTSGPVVFDEHRERISANFAMLQLKDGQVVPAQ